MKFFLLICSFFICLNCEAAKRGRSVYYENPVLPATAPDPSVIRGDDGTFYLYATGKGYPIYKSTDMIHWEFVGRVFNDANYPPLVRNNRKATLWAPEIRKINQKYVLFYTMWFGNVWLSAIGYATADSPTGPFVDRGVLIDSKPINVSQSIDQFYYEDRGKSYLFWGSFRDIYAIELSISKDVTIAIKPETKVKIAGTAFEGTNIWKRGGYYYMFASVGNYAGGAKSTYRTVVARSKKLLGPYVNKQGVSVLDNGFEEILHRSDKFTGPGHNAGIIKDDAGQTWMFYHAYQVSNLKLKRQGMLDKIEWDKAGWPYIADKIPSERAEAPIIKVKKQK